MTLLFFDGRREHSPILRNQRPIFEDLLDSKPTQVIERDDVGPKTRGNGSKIIEPEVFGGVDRSHLDGHDGIDSPLYGRPNHRIDVAFPD